MRVFINMPPPLPFNILLFCVTMATIRIISIINTSHFSFFTLVLQNSTHQSKVECVCVCAFWIMFIFKFFLLLQFVVGDGGGSDGIDCRALGT